MRETYQILVNFVLLKIFILVERILLIIEEEIMEKLLSIKMKNKQ